LSVPHPAHELEIEEISRGFGGGFAHCHMMPRGAAVGKEDVDEPELVALPRGVQSKSPIP
jgi:hypothetical protein